MGTQWLFFNWRVNSPLLLGANTNNAKVKVVVKFVAVPLLRVHIERCECLHVTGFLYFGFQRLEALLALGSIDLLIWSAQSLMDEIMYEK